MVSKQQIKFIHSLNTKKYRREHGLYVAEGAKIVKDLLQTSQRIHKLYATSEWLAEMQERFPGINPEIVTEKELKQLSSLTTPNEVLAIVEMKDSALPDVQTDIILALEGIRDPGNMGTIIRIADWYGLSHILCSEDCVDAWSPKVVQASMGSIFRLDINYVDLAEYFKANNSNIYAASLKQSQSLHEFNSFTKGVLLIGNEAKGISEELLALATHKLHIPAFGKAESLNAAVATGIFLDTMRRGLI